MFVTKIPYASPFIQPFIKLFTALQHFVCIIVFPLILDKRVIINESKVSHPISFNQFKTHKKIKPTVRTPLNKTVYKNCLGFCTKFALKELFLLKYIHYEIQIDTLTNIIDIWFCRGANS